MNFYKHHIGDYDSHTSHLTFLEDAAYSRLIRLYYRSEAPLPADVPHVCRLVRAASPSERKAVQAVLSEFFELAEDGWHSKRCDAEIELANKQAVKNRENGKGGGRPPKNKTQSVSSENPEETQVVSAGTEFGNLSQTPDSRLHLKPSLSGAGDQLAELPDHDDRTDIPGLSGYHPENWQPDTGRLATYLQRAGIPMPDPQALANSLTRFNLHHAGKPLTDGETYAALVRWLTGDHHREQQRPKAFENPFAQGSAGNRKPRGFEVGDAAGREFLRSQGIDAAEPDLG